MLTQSIYYGQIPRIADHILSEKERNVRVPCNFAAFFTRMIGLQLERDTSLIQVRLLGSDESCSELTGVLSGYTASRVKISTSRHKASLLKNSCASFSSVLWMRTTICLNNLRLALPAKIRDVLDSTFRVLISAASATC